MKMTNDCCALPLVLLMAMACREGPTQPRVGPASLVRIVSGEGQVATVGSLLPAPIMIRVTDESGTPVPGQIVNFVVTTGKGSLYVATSVTSDSGIAQNLWTLGTVARDTQTVEARAIDPGTGAPILSAVFHATGTPAAPAQLLKVAGDTQPGSFGLALVDSLQVRILDRYDNAVPGVAVSWMSTGGSSVSPTTSVTRADGTARAALVLGGQPNVLVSASAPELPPVSFSARGTLSAQSGAVLTKISGDAQTGGAGSTLAQPLVVRVVLGNGQPVVGALVEFRSGPSVSAFATSDSSGFVRAMWTLGGVIGAASLSAGIAPAPGSPFIGTPLAFTAVVQPGPAAQVTLVSGNAQTGALGLALPDSLRVKVTDAFGNPVPAALVGWTATGGSTLSAATTRTAAEGIAVVSWALGGNVVATATASVAPQTSVTFNATGIPTSGSGLVVTKTAGEGRVVVGGYGTASVRIALSDGRPVTGVQVLFRYGPATMQYVLSVSDADGLAAGYGWPMATTLGTSTVSAGVLDPRQPEYRAPFVGDSVVFSVTRMAGPPAALPVEVYSSRMYNWIPSTALLSYRDRNGGNPEYIPAIYAKVLDYYGNPAAGVAVTWSPVDGSIVRPMDSVSDSMGIARAHFIAGPAGGGVVATAGSIRTSVFVSPTGDTTGVTLFVSPSPVTLAVGRTENLLVRFRAPSTTRPMVDIDSDFLVWTSSNPVVAVVETGAPSFPARGILKALSPGTVTLTARNGSFSDSISVTVVP